MTDQAWPRLPLSEWGDTWDTLLRWMQMVGKTRLTLTPLVNHWWNIPLYVSARGLTTSMMHQDDLGIEMEFDFLSHVLEIRTSKSQTVQLPLSPRSVAQFYGEYTAALKTLGIDVHIYPVPVELDDVIPFPDDHTHASYDPEYAQRFWRILVQSERVFEEFRSRFIGKTSPTHFFWGGGDLALTRFSGRRGPEYSAPTHNVPVWVMREGYSHELLSAGFWPGQKGMMEEPIFYAYAYPEPPGYTAAAVDPEQARYDLNMRDFVLPYEAVRTAESPERALLDFLQSTYEAGAILGEWDRAALERYPVEPDLPSGPAIEIVENPRLRRFDAIIDGQAAFLDYRRRGKIIFLTHTEVPPAVAGRGIGSALARHALEFARANSLEVVPTCPFIANYVRQHTSYFNLLARGEPATEALFK